MGGMVTIASRYKNKEIVKFKTSTNFFHYNYNSPNIFDEEHLKSAIKKHDLLRDDDWPEKTAEEYDSRKGVLAPYEYGIILIDYYRNTLVSANNYSPIVRGSSARILEEYNKIFRSDFILKIQDYKTKEIQETIDLKENRFMDFQEIHLLHMALKHNVKIFFKDKELKHENNIESILESIYEIKLSGKDKQAKIETIREYFVEQSKINLEKYDDDCHVSFEDFADISFEYPNFKIIEGSGAEDCRIVYNYLKDNGFVLTGFEEQTWKEFLERVEK